MMTARQEDVRARFRSRLQLELGDEQLGATVVKRLTDAVVDDLQQLCAGDIAGSPTLSYRPSRTGQADSIWVFAFGYRFAPDVPTHDGEIPPVDSLLPGPTNIELAQCVQAMFSGRDVPVIAQWEVAEVLAELGVHGVVSVDPDVSADGVVTYLSTAGVTDKGQRLAAHAGIEPGRVAVVAHHDHVARCVATARSAGLDAHAPAGVDLPRDFDEFSGQRWTRDRPTWIATDLFARTRLDLDWWVTP